MRTIFLISALILSHFCISQNEAQKGSVSFADSILENYNRISSHDFKREARSTSKAYFYFLENGDSCKAIRAASLLSIAYDAMGKLDSGLHVMLEAKKLFSKKCEPFIHANYTLNLTNLYLSFDDPSKVEGLCKRELDSWSPLDSLAFSTYYGLLTNWAIAVAYQGRLHESMKIFQRIQLESVENKHLEDELDALLNMGSLYGMMGNLDSSYYYLNIAHELCGNMNCKVEANILSNMAACLSDLDRHEEALIWFDKGKKIAKQQGDLQLLIGLIENEALSHYELNHYAQAWSLIMEHNNLKDSLINIEKVNALAEVQEKYESQIRNQQIQELKLQSENDALAKERLKLSRDLFVAGGIIAIIIAIGIWSRLIYTRRTKKIIQKEKDISEAMLLNILPEEIAQELKEKGKADARDFELVSIMFTDFKSFTEQASQLSAGELVNEINHCFEAFDSFIEVYEIEKIKTIGDAYMAAGGLPVPTDNSVKNTVLAALDMQNFITRRKAENNSLNKPAFEMRIGIHTGPVVAGIVGVKKFQYDVWGDTVNTASRMESAGEVGKVNISQATYELLKDDPDFAFESRGKIEAKGKGEMEMWFVSKK